MHSFSSEREISGQPGRSFDLGLVASDRARVDLRWSGENDLDLHAVVCKATHGQKPTLKSALDVLSAYNVFRQIGQDEPGLLLAAADGSFSILDGALSHSPVTRHLPVGAAHEWVEFNASGWDSSTDIEIVLIAMLHPQVGSLTFKDVGSAELSITKLGGEVLLRSQLDAGFDDCFGVHVGTISIKRGASPVFVAIGGPLHSDFNKALELFA